MSSRFKEVCPRKLNDLPDLPCKNGINGLKGKGKSVNRCPWYVNSKISCYCWFKYEDLVIKNHGKMFEHTFEEIAKLDNCTATYIKIIEDKAFVKLRKRIKNNKELLKDFKKKFK